MEHTVLGLSALHGTFRALSLRSGTTAAFEWTTPPDDFGSLPQMLREAARRTGADSRGIAIVLAHPGLTHNIVETPPVKGWKLQQFLQRRVRTMKTFPAEADWSCQRALPTKKGEAVLIHLLPRTTLQTLSDGCQQAGLKLARVIPTTSVLSGQLRQLPLERDEVALLAAETGPTTTVVIGRKDGQMCLCRILWNNWNQNTAQVGMDLARTIGFVEQQLGLAIAGVWLFGDGAEQRLVQIQELLKRPVRLSPAKADPFYWAEQAIRLPDKDDGNLISLETRQAPMRRRFVTATTVLLVLFIIACLGTTTFFEVLRQSRIKSNIQLTEEIGKLQDRRKEWEKRYQDLADKKEFVKVVSENRTPPVPGWVLAYLGQVVPDDMVLTQLHVLRTNAQWEVQLRGLLQPTNSAGFNPNQALGALAERLGKGPFHLTTRRSVVDTPAGSERVRPAPQVGRQDTNALGFVIEGVIQ
jgi:hypothetical protein